mgnify:CR=1 FL=1
MYNIAQALHDCQMGCQVTIMHRWEVASMHVFDHSIKVGFLGIDDLFHYNTNLRRILVILFFLLILLHSLISLIFPYSLFTFYLSLECSWCLFKPTCFLSINKIILAFACLTHSQIATFINGNNLRCTIFLIQ